MNNQTLAESIISKHGLTERASRFRNNNLHIYDGETQTDNFLLNVLVSSSKGNASIINNKIQIDHGIPSKDMANLMRMNGLSGLRDLSLFITHQHIDHFNKNSIVRNIAFDKFYKKVYGTKNQINLLLIEIDGILNGSIKSHSTIVKSLTDMKFSGELDDMFIVIDDSSAIEVDDMIVKPIRVEHDGDDLPCYSFMIERNGETMIYATDLCNTDNLPKGKHELIAIENSWLEVDGINKVHLEKLSNHLRTEYAVNYIIDNLKDGGKYEQLHTSSYTSISLNSFFDRFNSYEELNNLINNR